MVGTKLKSPMQEIIFAKQIYLQRGDDQLWNNIHMHMADRTTIIWEVLEIDLMLVIWL